MANDIIKFLQEYQEGINLSKLLITDLDLLHIKLLEFIMVLENFLVLVFFLLSQMLLHLFSVLKWYLLLHSLQLVIPLVRDIITFLSIIRLNVVSVLWLVVARLAGIIPVIFFSVLDNSFLFFLLLG